MTSLSTSRGVKCIKAPACIPVQLPGSRRARLASESRQALRAVVGNLRAGDFLERTVGLRRVAHQLRGVAVDLIQIGTIRRNPAIAGSTRHARVETSGGPVARNLRARGILRDGEPVAVDAEAADVAVPEVRRKYESVIWGDAEPAQLRRQAGARVDLQQWADVEPSVCIDSSHGASVADGISDDERIRPAVQEGDVERRAGLPVLERGLSERAVPVHGKYDEAIGVRHIRGDHPEFAIWLLDPENW